MKILKFNPDEDMKELEKYDFKESNSWFIKEIECNDNVNFLTYYVIKNSGNIQVFANFDVNLDSTVYDLIKANLLIVEEKDEKRM